jgi:signal peptidase I
MNDSISNGDRVIILKHTSMRRSILRGDMALFREPGKNGSMIKRIVGMPGEKITFKEGVITIHAGEENLVLDEPYLSSANKKIAGENFSWDLGRGEYVVLGDNRGKSKDSRLFGKINDSGIMGRIAGKLAINKENKEAIGINFFDQYAYKKQGGILKAYPIKQKL